MSLLEKINALGKAVSSHHFCGRFEGVAAVLYECVENVNGTHFAAVVQLTGDVTVLPITSEEAARKAYYALVKGLHAEQDKEAA
jgi:hypothetical protein